MMPIKLFKLSETLKYIHKFKYNFWNIFLRKKSLVHFAKFKSFESRAISTHFAVNNTLTDLQTSFKLTDILTQYTSPKKDSMGTQS